MWPRPGALNAVVPGGRHAGEAGKEMVLEGQLAGLSQKMEALAQEMYDNAHTQLESQEEHNKHVRTLCKTRYQQYRSLSERMERENWEGRLKQLHCRVDYLTKGSMDHNESVEISRQLEAAWPPFVRWDIGDVRLDVYDWQLVTGGTGVSLFLGGGAPHPSLVTVPLPGHCPPSREMCDSIRAFGDWYLIMACWRMTDVLFI